SPPTLTGSRASALITASPRKTCVPGVQAWAAAGVSASATTASATSPAIAPARWSGDRRRSDPKPLPLAPNRLPQILELGLDGVVDRVTRPFRVVRDLAANLFVRHPTPQVAAALSRPSRAGEPHLPPVLPGPGRSASDALHDRRHRPPPAGPATEQVG